MVKEIESSYFTNRTDLNKRLEHIVSSILPDCPHPIKTSNPIREFTISYTPFPQLITLLLAKDSSNPWTLRVLLPSNGRKLAPAISGQRKRRKQQRNMKMFEFLRLPDFKHDRNEGEKSIGIVLSSVETDSVHTWIQTVDHVHQLAASSVFVCSRGAKKLPRT